ncbi:restriction endonuclease subunit S [uncultured Thiocystis sp.]|uniref:restriction endonuclease subunit S n=1 Tax=uncultured Thiocystis sp. TaxID=1202134 RepID=UPI0025FA53F9|nr:restriction endonuclease subunit S [uncultured Thiocystis sp.]
MTIKHIPISEVAAVLPGYALKGSVVPDPDGRYQLIQGKHLIPGEPYHYLDAHRLRIKPAHKADRYRVGPGDVLIASRGTANYAVVIESVPEPTIAPATFYILRPGPEVDAAYLAWVLEQPIVQAQIAQVRTGAATPILQREDFANVRIPLPPLAEQRRITQTVVLMRRERQLLRRLDTATSRYHEAIGRALLGEPPAAHPQQETQ